MKFKNARAGTNIRQVGADGALGRADLPVSQMAAQRVPRRRTRGSASLPVNFMDTSLIGPIFRLCCQSRAHRIILNIKPFLVVILLIPQPVMKTTPLKCARIGTCFCQAIFPVRNPTFNREFQIMRDAEQMQVIGHQQIIAYQPGGGLVFPNVLKRAFNKGLNQPAFAVLRADGKKNPIQSTGGNMNAFGRRAALWQFIVHGESMAFWRI